MQKHSNHKVLSVVLLTLLIVSCFAIFVPQASCAVTWAYSPSTNTATASGAGSTNFAGLVAADKAGSLDLASRAGITAIDANPVALTYNLRPADLYVLGLTKLYITVSSFLTLTTATITIAGTDAYGTAQSEMLVVTGNGQYNSVYSYHTLATSQVTVFTGIGSFTYKVTQGQWGVFSADASGTQISVNAKISIENTVVFEDTNKQIYVDCSAVGINGAGQSVFIGNGGSIYSFGTANQTYKTGTDGCDFYFTNVNYAYTYVFNAWDWNTQFYFYGGCIRSSGTDPAMVRASGTTSTYHAEIYSCLLINTFIAYWYSYSSVNWVALHGGTFQFCSAQINNCQIFGALAIVGMDGSGATTLKNIYARNNTSLAYINNNLDNYLINIDTDTWHFYSMSGSFKVFRQYEFDLTVANYTGSVLNNTSISLAMANGTSFYSGTTNSSGQIPTQTMTYGFYNQTGGDTIYSSAYSPYTLTITNSQGYDNYTAVFTPLSKTSLQIALNNQYQTGWNTGNATGYSNGYNAGWNVGNTTGYDAGWIAGNSTGYINGWAVGNATGYANGYSDGYTVGYDDGYVAGWNTGNTTGFTQGWIEGNSTGYIQGVASITFLGNATTNEVLQGNTFYSTDHTLQTGVYTAPTPNPDEYVTADNTTAFVIVGAIVAAAVVFALVFTIKKRDE